MRTGTRRDNSFPARIGPQPNAKAIDRRQREGTRRRIVAARKIVISGVEVEGHGERPAGASPVARNRLPL